ncbi:MAG TPA: ferric reductase-like transmembrane domain-containing protein [Solirubrobacteraceae bacterium]|nr:ferric reductase-like transmembrane domain-containing protein [Solirubrobacteraceae bacterium]
MSVVAAAGPSAYWYLTRGTGTVTLILLTLSVALGVANVRRLRTENVPRFVLDAVHRSVSLLAMAFLVIHILFSVLDSFAPIRLIDAVIPFAGVYRPLWLGLGTVAFDLMLAVTVTSLVRRRLGYRAWRIVHWASYASWPVALLHGLGTGSDTRQGWMLVIVGGCVILMVVAVVARATAGWPDHLGGRVPALGASALVPLGLLIWLPGGPLAAGWAKRAGTPASLLRAAATSSPTSSAPSSSSSATPGGFTARASGTVQQGSIGDGVYGVDISLSLSGHQLNALAIHLRGKPLDGGGLEMTSSEVSLGTSSNPGAYRGAVTSLQGSNISAQVRDPSGHVLNLVAELQIDPGNGSASGTVTARP